MQLIQPFAGLRPAPGRAGDVAAPPYDVVSESEARARVAGRPWSFLHVSRAEVDLPAGTDPYAPEVYRRARANLDGMRSAGVLVRDAAPAYYVYRLTMGGHVQTGLVAAASVKAYDQGLIRKHEHTRPAKEDDRVRQIEALNAQTGPVLLAYRADPRIDGLIDAATREEPVADVDADGVRHQIWPVNDGARIAALSQAGGALGALYVADGHHRSAAASRVAATLRAAAPAAGGVSPFEGFLAVLFPHEQMRILAYNRVIADLNGLTPAELLRRIAESARCEPSDEPVRPARSGEVGVYLGGRWYRLQLDRPTDGHDPVGRLDVSLLQEQVIGPLLGIDDPRRDPRIDFVGGIRGLEGLTARVDSGEMAIAFALYPTSMDELMDVADAGRVMPPKSTWFEPKLADGLVSLVL